MQGGTEIRGHSGTIKDGENRRRRSNLRERGHCQGEESQQRSRPMVTQVFVHYVAVSYSLDTISHQVQCPHVFVSADAKRLETRCSLQREVSMQSTDPRNMLGQK